MRHNQVFIAYLVFKTLNRVRIQIDMALETETLLATGYGDLEAKLQTAEHLFHFLAKNLDFYRHHKQNLKRNATIVHKQL